MTSVAGDLYDYIVGENHQVGLLIADVRSWSSRSPYCIHGQARRSFATSGCCRSLSVHVRHEFGFIGQYAEPVRTAAYVHLNSESEELRYSAAAHPPLLMVRNGGVIQIEENGLTLGTFGYASYSTAVDKLEAGDRIVMYTDGILEASNAAGDFFGQDALCDLLTETRGLSPALAADRVISSVRQWSGKQDDDLTVLICDYIHKEPGSGGMSEELIH
jgi:phosphoserine phosphatase RsbU/P